MHTHLGSLHLGIRLKHIGGIRNEDFGHVTYERQIFQQPPKSPPGQPAPQTPPAHDACNKKKKAIATGYLVLSSGSPKDMVFLFKKKKTKKGGGGNTWVSAAQARKISPFFFWKEPGVHVIELQRVG
jgi:hypothetical protein